nr:glycosyltransferase family 4 protein [Echinimonas agarilytica]
MLLVTSNYPRWKGDSTTPFVHNLAKDLVAKGHEVTVLAPHFVGAERREVMDGVTVKRFYYCFPLSAQTVCYQGGALVNLRKKPHEKLKLPIFVLAECFAVFKELVLNRYDVINAHWIVPQGFASVVASCFFKTPVVTTVHGGDIFSLKGKFMVKLKRWVLRHTRAVSVNSSFTEAAVKDIMACQPTSDHVERIPMGVKVGSLPPAHEVAEIRAKFVDSPTQKLAVFVGRVIDEKGIFEAVDAIRALRESKVDVKLLVIGEGQDKAELEARIKLHKLEAYINPVGWVDHDMVQHYMAAADAFVGPSKESDTGWVEAQGLTFLEAMAAGAIVVGSRSGGIVDSIVDGESGFLCEPANSQSLAQTLEQAFALSDSDREQMTLHARERVQQIFSREISANSFEALFQKLKEQR